MIHLIVYQWPVSQICSNCEHGEFLNSESFQNSHYICNIAYRHNDGIFCPYKKEKIESKLY